MILDPTMLIFRGLSFERLKDGSIHIDQWYHEEPKRLSAKEVGQLEEWLKLGRSDQPTESP
jgi:hypothetical protein